MLEKEQLVAAAKELNDVLGLSPAINFKAKRRELVRQLHEAMKEILPADIFSDKTTEVIEYYNSALQDTVTEEEEPATMKVITIQQEEEEEEEEEEEDPELVQVEKEVQNFEESFDKALEDAMKGPRKKTLVQKKEAERTALAEVKRQQLAERRGFVANLIASAKHTRQEILDTTLVRYPDWNKSTLSTLLTDSLNPKYNVFDVLVKRDAKTNILSFVSKG